MVNILRHIGLFLLVILFDFFAMYIFVTYCNYVRFSDFELLVFIPLSFIVNIVLAVILPIRKLGKYSWVFILNAFVCAAMFALVLNWSINNHIS